MVAFASRWDDDYEIDRFMEETYNALAAEGVNFESFNKVAASGPYEFSLTQPEEKQR